VPLLVDLSPGTETAFYALDRFIWVAFVLEYGIRLYLAPSKRYFVSHNIIDLLFVLIPFLRPLRVFRSARAFALFRATRGMVVLLRAVDAVQDVLKRHKLGYTLLIAMVVVVGSGLLVATIEASDPDRNIRTIPDGLWWAVGTITTAAYGDRFPVTVAGRAIAAGVMILGIGLFGLIAATLASFLVEKDLDKELDPQIAEISERLERIERLLQRQPSDEGTDGSNVSESD
jgi:voltage-gated potassium channel